MLASIIDKLKEEVGPDLMSKVGLEEKDLSSVMDVVGESSQDVLSNQLSSGNIGSMMSLFSSGSNNSGADGIQSQLTTSIVSGLASKLGLSESKAQMIGSIVVPYLIKMISSKNSETPDDDPSPLKDLLGAGTGGIMDKAKKGLGGFFN